MQQRSLLRSSWLRLSAVALLVSFAGGCSSTVELTQSASGSTQTFAVGEEFEVILSENGTTGITWGDPAIADAAIVGAKGDEFESSSDLDGGGGARTFLFECLAAGTTSVEITQTGTSTPNSFSVTVACSG